MQAWGASAAAPHQFSIYPIPYAPAICTFFAPEPVWDASTLFPDLSSKDVCQHGAIQGCSLLQWLTSHSLGTLGSGSINLIASR